MYASPFNDESNNESIENNINNKKITHNRTQKNYEKKINSDKVNSVLESIHNSTDNNEELGDYYGNPPPKPTSIGSEKANNKESMQNNTGENYLGSLGPTYSEKSDLELNNFNSNYIDNVTAEDYYKKYIPNFSPEMTQKYLNNNNQIKPHQIPSQLKQPQHNIQLPINNHELFTQKLNYMIHLLEEQQDERTNNVTEEVVLYSFLGIFIIFIVDSFTRVGKYTR